MNTVHSLEHQHTLKIEKSKTDAKYVGGYIANNLKLKDLISLNCWQSKYSKDIRGCSHITSAGRVREEMI